MSKKVYKTSWEVCKEKEIEHLKVVLKDKRKDYCDYLECLCRVCANAGRLMYEGEKHVLDLKLTQYFKTIKQLYFAENDLKSFQYKKAISILYERGLR